MNETAEQRLKIIEDMLTVILRSQNNIHWIGGYVYGKTKGGDPYIILYPAAMYLNEKACRVYPQDFKKLPAFIPTQNISGKTRGNPNKQEASDLGIYNECPLFQIVTYDGKDTPLGSEKRFGKVLRVSRQNIAAAPAQAQEPERAVVNPPVPAARPLTTDEREHYTQEAMTAENEFLFLTAAQKLFPQYSYDSLLSMRSTICEKDFVNAAAQLSAIQKYVTTRAEQEKRVDTTSAHKTAKIEAAALYKKLLQGE